MAERKLNGLRVLIVEDESMVSMLIEDMLMELGCEVAGTATQIDEALQLIGSQPVDAAILDVNLGGRQTDVVADELVKRSIPFVFATGYGAAGLPKSFSKALALQKPFQQRELEHALSACVAAQP